MSNHKLSTETTKESAKDQAPVTASGGELKDEQLEGVAGGTKDLEARDRMGNFEIQNLMSSYNQAETLASSIAKKKSDTEGGIINKI